MIQTASADRGTSVAIILLIVALIFICTLWPFDGVVTRPANLHWHLFILEWGKVLKLDVLANIVMFLPFGFCVANHLAFNERFSSVLSLIISVAVMCFVLSYSIELMQLLLPSRHSSLIDVISNSLGGMLGFFCFQTRTIRNLGPHAS
jgi:glycopeptide antibiotics resistance protein